MTTQSFTAILTETGPIIIDHNGEDTDLVITDHGSMPAIIEYTPSEEWEPEIYRRALAANGWTLTTDWTTAMTQRHGYATTATVTA